MVCAQESFWFNVLKESLFMPKNISYPQLMLIQRVFNNAIFNRKHLDILGAIVTCFLLGLAWEIRSSQIFNQKLKSTNLQMVPSFQLHFSLTFCFHMPLYPFVLTTTSRERCGNTEERLYTL